MLFELDFGVGAPDVEGKLGKVERKRRHTNNFFNIFGILNTIGSLYGLFQCSKQFYEDRF